MARKPGGAVIHDALAVVDLRPGSEGGVVLYDPPYKETWVIGGHVRLQQVIVNLINNALDAMEGQPNREVTISVKGATLSVRDTGAGIDPDKVAHIFDPFFTTKAPGKGLGLGLSISFNIVSDLGGVLSAPNHPDGGAVFTVTLQETSPSEVAAQ